MKMNEKAEKIIKMMNDAGEKAYCVGGCVRDILLGKEPHDFDICTSAHPEKTEEILKEFPVIETGIKHGTVTVLVDGEPFEITTWRIDGKYSDNRRPENVTFTPSLEEDLKRRDFTINAMAFDGEEVIDPFGGKEDLKNGIIRAVGDPNERFEEDALRILRALRFASKLGFEIETKTAVAMREKKELLKEISAERIFSELKLILCGKDATKVLLDFSDIIGQIIPEIKPTIGFEQHNKHHVYDVYTHTAVAVGSIDPDPTLRLTMLLHDIGKALDHEFEGTHVALGVEYARKYREKEDIIHAIQAHHGDVECRTLVACLVQAADAISAARPGARRENLENYIKRLEKLEEITGSYPGVEKSYAIQAGREVRVMVKPEQVSEDEMVILARELAKRIESELEYPGQIKVHVLRETKVVEYAK